MTREIMQWLLLLVVAINGCAMPWALGQVMELDDEIQRIVVSRHSHLPNNEVSERKRMDLLHQLSGSAILQTIVIFLALIGVPLWKRYWARVRLTL
jgi:hypothetical protein